MGTVFLAVPLQIHDGMHVLKTVEEQHMRLRCL